MEVNKVSMKVEVSVKDMWVFTRLLELYGKVLVDERIHKDIRGEYFRELNHTFEAGLDCTFEAIN